MITNYLLYSFKSIFAFNAMECHAIIEHHVFLYTSSHLKPSFAFNDI